MAGDLLDRFGLRLVLGLDNLLRGLLLLVIPLLAAFGELRIGYLYPVVIVTGLITGATEVGQEVAVPSLVPDAELESANALLGATFDLAEWAGPAAAGLLVSLTGIQPAIYVDAATFLIMAICSTALQVTAHRSIRESLTELGAQDAGVPGLALCGQGVAAQPPSYWAAAPGVRTGTTT